ncbi:MauE/DoxX family redox-associated membrane protein [Mucilaginibacter ximonensis]|uniref:MauE/DoxX family redox-associated membrane protein n=1 Tax=Mucilaginibacter ximonensis TaxID=538021 RepID=A0ABW5YAI9_9SPHI
MPKNHTIELLTNGQKTKFPKHFDFRNTTLDVIAFLFIFLFVYAAISKLIDFQQFEVQLDKSPVLTGLSRPVKWLVPGVELLISMLLVFSKRRLLGFYAAFSMMVMFTAYIIIILNFSSYIPCSCGGILESMNWHQHLWFNLCFVGLGVLSILIYPSNKKLLQ